MKKIILAILWLTALSVFSQTIPHVINYQGLARDINGDPVITNISVKLFLSTTPLSGGSIYQETYNNLATVKGLFNIKFGSAGAGIPANLNWASQPYYLVVEIDPTGGNNFVSIGSQQLLSVPMALYAEKAGNVTNYSAGTNVNINGNTINATPSLNINVNNLSISGGNTVMLPNAPPQSTLTSSPNATVTSIGTNSFDISIPNYIAGTNVTITPAGGNNYSISSGPGVGNPPGFFVNAPHTSTTILNSTTLNIVPMSSTVSAGNTNITVSGAAPNFTISSTPTLAINAGSLSISNGNTVTLPLSPPPTSITGIGSATVTNIGQSFTINTPASPPPTSITGIGTSTVTNIGQSFTINTPPGSPPAWSLSGNSITVDGTNFIGTTDNVPFNIKVNNQKAGRIDHILFNTFFGHLAGNSITSGNNNTAVGKYALTTNLTGNYNTAMGSDALRFNVGSNNTAYGVNALAGNSTGAFNTASGLSSLFANTTGGFNTAHGVSALQNNVSGGSNSSVGYQSLLNSNGNNNTALGTAAGYSTTGNGNVFLGYQAGYNELGSNKLYIANSSSAPLIYGDFSSGNVGIGTTFPSASLHINSLGSFDQTLKLTNTAGASAGAGVYLDALNKDWIIFASNPVAGSGDQKLVFRDYSNATDRMVIDANGLVGIGTTIPTAQLEVNQYTKLGSGAPAVQMKKLTSFAPGGVGGTINVAHGLTFSKILSVSVIIDFSIAAAYPPNNTSVAQDRYYEYYYDALNVVVTLGPTALGMVGKPIKILIVYEQ